MRLDLLPDLCDEYGDRVHVCEPVFTSFGGRKCYGGEIVTIKCFEGSHRIHEILSGPGEGCVLVIDGGGSMRHALCGDVLAGKAMANGWEGIIIHGCVRDAGLIGEMSIGLHALAAYPIGVSTSQPAELGIPVRFAGVTFTPGHFVYADLNGVLTSPVSLTPP